MRHAARQFPSWLICDVGHMKTSLIIVLLVLPAIGWCAGIPEDPKIVASVTEILDRRSTPMPGICIRMIIHSPNELRGARFELFDRVRSRHVIRQEFPTGVLFSLYLPPPAISGVRRYKFVAEENERKLDAGIPPENIGESPVLPRVDLGKLKRQPSTISIP